jgi:hypothetical protein
VREVLLKNKFLTVSPRYLYKTQSVAEGEKSLNQVIQLAMSVFILCLYVWDLTKGEKKIRDTMASLLFSERAPPDWGLHPELATMVDRRGISAENAQKGDSWKTAPPPSRTLPSLQR